MGRVRVENILMRRDGISREEAREIVDYAIKELQECGDDYELAEDIMYGDLGLELDYLMDLL